MNNFVRDIIEQNVRRFIEFSDWHFSKPSKSDATLSTKRDDLVAEDFRVCCSIARASYYGEYGWIINSLWVIVC